MRISIAFSYSSLKKKNVKDSNGKSVGKSLIDVVFSPDLSAITHFVVGGGLVEEFLEDIKLKKDIDPVFSTENVDEVDKDVKLSVSKADLKAVIEGGIPSGHYRFKDLSKMTVVDSSGAKIGHIIDVVFFDDGSLSFIIGGGFLEEFLEGIKVIPDVDLILPSKNMTRIENKVISTDLTREQLKTTLQDEIEKGTDFKNSNYQNHGKEVAFIGHQTMK